MLKSGKKWNRIRSLLASQCAGIPRQVNLRRKNYSASIISEREFKKSKETLNSKAKCQRCQGKGKLPNRAQPYTRVDEELFWSEGKFESHNCVAYTNVILKIWQIIWVSEAARTITTLTLKIFSILQMVAGSKVVQSEENLTKTRQGGLRNKTRSSLRQTRSTNGGE